MLFYEPLGNRDTAHVLDNNVFIRQTLFLPHSDHSKEEAIGYIWMMTLSYNSCEKMLPLYQQQHVQYV